MLVSRTILLILTCEGLSKLVMLMKAFNIGRQAPSKDSALTGKRDSGFIESSK